MRNAPFAVHIQLQSNRTNVDCSQLCAVLRIGLGVKRDLLTLGERFEALGLDCREMNEHIVAALFVGNKAVAFFCVEPLHCTFIHFGYLRKIFVYPEKNKSPNIRKSVSFPIRKSVGQGCYLEYIDSIAQNACIVKTFP